MEDRIGGAALASLSADEISHATAALARAMAPAEVTFYEASLHEDFSSEQKEAFFSDGDAALPPRRAHIVASIPARRHVFVAHAPVSADAADQRVIVRVVDNVQAPITGNEYTLTEKLVIEHEPFRAACRARLIDPSDVRVDTWCVGWFSEADNPSRRLAEPILYVQRGDAAHDTLYTQPLEGFILRVDLWATPPAVVAFECTDGDAPAPPPPVPIMRFPDPAAEALRAPLAPLTVSQPDGAGFALDAATGRLQWQQWSGVLSFNAREGLVLSALTYAGRPVAWRLSFAEMVVPYGARAGSGSATLSHTCV